MVSADTFRAQRLVTFYAVPFEFNLLLTILKWCLLALLYLFFFRVLQATIRSSQLAQSAGQGGARSRLGRRRGANANPADLAQPASIGAASRVVLLEPAALAGQELLVKEHLTFGRAPSCDVALDDTYLSQVHMRVSLMGPGMVVEDLGSTNGTFVNDMRLETPVRVAIGDRVRIGETVMELR